jgi:hypothetical protein
MELESVLQDVIQNNEIKELYLKRIPVLITCDNWKKVIPVGWVEHRTSLAFYRGGLVELKGRIYFVTDKTIDALSEFIDFKFKNRIQVITE